MYENRKKDRAKTLERRAVRSMKYAGLVEWAVDLEVAKSEYRIIVAELRGGAH